MKDRSFCANPAGFALLLMTMAALPLANAGGAADAGVLVAYVEDDHGTGCSHPLAGFCFFNVTGMEDGIGVATINASQSPRDVGVATNLSVVREPAGDLWIAPDQNVTFDASQPIVKHPVNRLVVETWQAHLEERWSSEEYRLVVNSENVTFGCDCPGTKGGGDVTESKNRTYILTPWSDHCITYEHVGPCNAYPSMGLDDRIDGNVGLLCLLEGVPCEILLPVVREAQDQTPDVVVGLQYDEVQVATDSSDLSRGPDEDEPSSALLTLP